MRKLVLLACLFFSMQFSTSATPDSKEDIKEIKEMATAVLESPTDSNDIMRLMSGLTVGMWMMTDEDYKFDMDSAVTRMIGDNADMSMLVMCAVTEYQIDKKIYKYNIKVRNAVAKRVVKYVSNPANKLPPYTTPALYGAVMADKKGKLEEYLDRISKPIDKTSTVTAMEAAGYVLNSPFDTANKLRQEQASQLLEWMFRTPDYMFSMALPFTGVDGAMPVLMAAMVEYQVVNKVNAYDNEVRNAAVKRLIQYISNPANNMSPKGWKTLEGAIAAEKQGKLEAYLDKL